MSAKPGRAGNRVPALFHITLIGFFKPVGQAYDTVLKLGPFEVTHTVKRREFSGGKPAYTFDDRFDKVRFGVREFLALRDGLDPGVDVDGEQLVLSGGRVGVHGGRSLEYLVNWAWPRYASRLARVAASYSAERMSGKNVTQTALADAEGIARAAQILADGGLVAVPTETVYGLAARADDDAAVARIYEAKGRPSFNPLIVHVRDAERAKRYADFPSFAHHLARTQWPGPLTLVLPRRKDAQLADSVTAGLPTVALRVPAHPVTQALLQAIDFPIAAPSANRSGFISPTSAAHVLTSLDGRIDLVLDAGPACEEGIESTILAIREDDTWEELRAGPLDPKWLNLDYKGRDRPSDYPLAQITAPGQLASHYAPGKPVRLDASEAEWDEFLIGFGAIEGDCSLSPSGSLEQAAARLYDCLHQGAASQKPRIAVAPVPEKGVGRAINDRLRRAATPPQ